MGFMNVAPDGEFKVYVGFNAKAGRWYTKKDGKDEQLFEVTDMTAVFDMTSLKTGWFKFNTNVAPEKVIDPSFSESAPNPGQDFKRGFQLDLYSEKNLLGLREFTSTASIVIKSMNALYDAWMAAPEMATGQLPVVRCVGVTPVSNKHGTNYQPQFEIIGWTDRPAALGDGGQQAVPPVTQAPAPAPVAAAPAAHMPPPVAPPAASAPAPAGAPLF
ncbi:hypothetical protein [Novosphingobium sp.]|uniref:hypothetical protein n=1 Tax=Novosphingobium sp. TaxID=1874826 RepID=UPI0035AE256C